jgi:hypothetical protein
MKGYNDQKSLTFTVMGVPPSANVLKRKYRNPHAYARLRDEWQRTIYYSIGPQFRCWLEAMAKLGKRMSVKITIQHKKLYDEDNAMAGCKPLLDSLVRLKLLADDDTAHLELSVDQEKINMDSTRITICEA